MGTMDLQSHHSGHIPHRPSSSIAPCPEPLLSRSDIHQCATSIQTPQSEPLPSLRDSDDLEVYTAIYDEPGNSGRETERKAAEDMEQCKTEASTGVLSTLIAHVPINSWFKAYYPKKFPWMNKDWEEIHWTATSKVWLDKNVCRWLNICGGTRVQFARDRPSSSGTLHQASEVTSDGDWKWQDAWTEPRSVPLNLDGDETASRAIPDYVFEHAPLVHLFSKEQYWPCDIAEHLHHVSPELNYTAIQSESEHATLTNLDSYNQYQHGRWVFLTSNDNVEDYPDWLGGQKNIPNVPDNLVNDFSDNDGWIHHPGKTYTQGLKEAVADLKDWLTSGDISEDSEGLQESTTSAKAHAKAILEKEGLFHQDLKRGDDERSDIQRVRGGRSEAPAVLVAIDKGHGVVDAFWFFFYSFNLGNSVFNVRFGNHVGDWEHTAIRFYKGKPKAVFFSEHNFGSAYSYDAVEKIGKRPVIYSAVGTHAMYATPGLHPYVLPWGILHDETDRGPLWDPVLNSHTFTYDFQKGILRASNATPEAPTEWFHFAGHWGDKFYPLGDKRQYRFAGQYHYVNGPLGPKFKNLGRKKICGGPDSQPCNIKHWLGGSSRAVRSQQHGEEADMYTADMHAEQDLKLQL